MVENLSKPPDEPSPPELRVLGGLLRHRVEGAESERLLRALGMLMFPDGLDPAVLRPLWANDTPVSQPEVDRFIDDARELHERYGRLTKPPHRDRGGVTYDLEVGVSLVVRLTNELLTDFKDRSANDAGTFTGDGYFSSAQFHQMVPRVEQLASVLSGINRLLKIIKNCAETDKGDLRALEEAADHEDERWNQDTPFVILSRLFTNWKIGYGIPGSCITDKEANNGLFHAWRYVSWDDYLTSALFFFDDEHGFAFASSTAKDKWRKESGAVLNLLADLLAGDEIHPMLEKIMSLVPRVIADPKSPDYRAQLRRHFQPPKSGHRNTVLAAKRTPDDEEFLKHKITRIRPVKFWRCNSDRCTYTLDQSRIPHSIDAELHDRGSADTREDRSPRFKPGHRSAFDRYVCPAWWHCRGLLVPIFDDSVRT